LLNYRRKTKIKSNWAKDANVIAETARGPQGYPNLGRFHGLSANWNYRR
jgi:hypothetical protein